MNVHPDILVHWTDRRWAKKKLTPALRSKYVKRLCDFYQKGLWLTHTEGATETIHGAFHTKTKLRPRPCLCFTELRLSQVTAHIARFGSLGIGFRRQFMLNRGANPVFYLQNFHAGVVNTNLAAVARAAKTDETIQLFTSYMKPMSARRSQTKFPEYDQMEWRCVDCCIAGTNRRPYPIKNGHPTFTFHPRDVEIIIFPDKQTRVKALKDKRLQNTFRKHPPMMIDSTELVNL
jgi:hypothetical protein